jgi:CheY-like chemotaxis protein
VPFDLDDTVRQTVKAFVPRARDKRIDLDLEIASEVPWAVVGDAVRLRQVLVNLLDNAVRFTDRGGVETRVTLEESGERSVVVHFSVKDTGIGIARDRQESIFESFTQVDGSTTRRYGGTGLGLTISMRLVEMLGGRIWLESEPSKGSTFHFTARFELGDEGLEHLREEDAARAAARRIPPLSVLVAEDNLVNRTLIARILQKLGHRVVEARDGNEALKKLEHEDVDVVLMDLEMPHVGGIEVTQRIRERERATGGHLPIIALTAHARPEDRDRCLAAGMDGYVSKPIRRGVLFSTIAASLPEERLARGVPREAESGDGDEATEDLVSLFAETGAQDVRRIREALGIGDADGARQVAHSLAGAALVLHAEGVVRVARDLEAAAERGDLDGARSLCDALAREVERFGPS